MPVQWDRRGLLYPLVVRAKGSGSHLLEAGPRYCSPRPRVGVFLFPPALLESIAFVQKKKGAAHWGMWTAPFSRVVGTAY
jgi:hypothetical protein